MLYKNYNSSALRFWCWQKISLLNQKTNKYSKNLPLLFYDPKLSIIQMPPLTLMGNYALEELGPELSQLGASKILIITDKNLSLSPIFKRLIGTLDKWHINYILFDEVIANPTIEIVNLIKINFIKQKCNYLVSFGGGSAHDAAKAAAIIISNNISDLRGIDKLKFPPVGVVCVNTTTGTGSEANSISIITDEKKSIKVTSVDKFNIPILTISDPSLTISQAPNVTANGGMNILALAIEAYLSPYHKPITDILATRCIELIGLNLVNSYESLKNNEYRSNLITASYMVGLAHGGAGSGYVDAISNAISGSYNTAHGVASAILLPYIISFLGQDKGIAKRINKINYALNNRPYNANDKQAVVDCARSIFELNYKLKIPNTLKGINVTPDNFKKLSKKVMNDYALTSSPKRFSKKEIISILEHAYSGKLF